MISRLTLIATVFAAVTTASLAYAASTHQEAAAAQAQPVRVIQLERVVIVGQRLPA